MPKTSTEVADFATISGQNDDDSDIVNQEVSATSKSSVTFFPGSHKRKSFHPDHGFQCVDNEEPAWTLFSQVYGIGNKVPVELLQTSLPREPGSIGLYYHDIIPQTNGFIYTVIEAYNHHRALILRPDDVWLAILMQFNLYVNGNAERLRNHFVSHEGKQKLQVISLGDRYSVNFAEMCRTMARMMKTRIVDPDLQNWVSPTFSTTTLVDKTIYAIIMMASLKEYFEYEFALDCGIPQVTLEGTKQDWEAILVRLPKLQQYGKETSSWYSLLKPVISRFVSAYDDPHSAANHEFWKKVAHVEDEGSGECYLAGWITAFCFFRADGTQARPGSEGLVLDGIVYPKIDTEDIPSGWAEVDVKLNESGKEVQTIIVAGSIGSRICVGADSVRDTTRPLSAWWCLVTENTGDFEAVEEME